MENMLFWLLILSQPPETTGTTSDDPPIYLTGIGTSIPYVAYKELGVRFEVHRDPYQHVEFEYTPENSLAGICSVTGECEQTSREGVPYVYGACDFILTEKQQVAFPAVKVFPVMAAAVVVIHSIPGVEKPLNLDLPSLARIFSGEINYWNDIVIQRLNPDIVLPSMRINVIVRKDSSGTTNTLSAALTAADPVWAAEKGTFSMWDKLDFIDADQATSHFAQGTIGMIGMLKSIPYSIGYTSLGAAEEYKLKIVQLYDEQYNLIQASQVLAGVANSMQLCAKFLSDGTGKADNCKYLGGIDTSARSQRASGANKILSRTDRENLKMTAGLKGTYPMTLYTYLIVNSTTWSRISCDQVVEFLHYVYWLMHAYEAQHEAKQKYLLALSQVIVEGIEDQVLKKISCRGELMWPGLENQIAKETTFEEKRRAFIILTSGIAVSIVIVLSLAGLLLHCLVHRRNINKVTNLEPFLWKLSDFIIETLPTEYSNSGNSFESSNESFNTKSTAKIGSQKQIQLVEHRKQQETLMNEPTYYDNEVINLENAAGEIDSLNSSSSLTRIQKAAIRDHHGSGQLMAKHRSSDLNQYVFFEAHFPDNIDAAIRGVSRKQQRDLRKYLLDLNHEDLLKFSGIIFLNSEHKSFGIYYSTTTELKWIHTVFKSSKYEISEEVRSVLANNVALAIEYLHMRNIVHGTISSANIFIDARWTIKLGDWARQSLLEAFGGPGAWSAFFSSHIAGYLKNLSEDRHIDMEPKLMLQYADPVQLIHGTSLKGWQNAKNLDIYSFGILLIEIWTMDEPLAPKTTNMESPEEAIKQVHAGIMRQPIPAWFTKDLRVIVERCIHPITDTRPGIATVIDLLMESPTVRNSRNIVETLMKSMESYMNSLEEKVEERTQDLKITTDRMELLLSQMLPLEIARKLQNNEAVHPEYFDEASVYFSDIVGFTSISANSSPLEIVTFLNELYTFFDDLIDQFDVYKVETIGDAYMVVSGVPKRNALMHASEITKMSIVIVEQIEGFVIPHRPEQPLQIRVGLNSGPVMAGVVGNKMPRYCLFGDTVNTASRMESTGLPMRIQAADTTVNMLKQTAPNKYTFVKRGVVEVKGKGTMETFFIELDMIGGGVKPKTPASQVNSPQKTEAKHIGSMAV